jgi:hypothetical protein
VALATGDIVFQEIPFPKEEKVSISVLCGSKVTSVTISNGKKGGAKVFDASRKGLSVTRKSLSKVNSEIARSRAVYLSSPYCEGKDSISFLVSGSYLDTKLGEEDDFNLKMSLDFVSE